MPTLFIVLFTVLSINATPAEEGYVSNIKDGCPVHLRCDGSGMR